jgi:hypothetical protein
MERVSIWLVIDFTPDFAPGHTPDLTADLVRLRLADMARVTGGSGEQRLAHPRLIVACSTPDFT